MLRIRLISSITPFLFLFLIGCGSSPVSDAKKAAELACEVNEMTQKMATGDIDMEEFQKFQEKAAAYGNEMKEKYKDDPDAMEEYITALKKENMNCD